MSFIKFGTDGWRAVIAEDFTFENLEKVINAYARFILNKKQNPRIIIGYDARFMSEKYADFVAEKLKNYGFLILLNDKVVPTPLISWGVKNYKCDGGIVITSSHNPYIYNGFKVKNEKGAGFSRDQVKELEKNLYIKKELKIKEGKIEKVNYDEEYLKSILNFIDIMAIKKSKIKIVVDVMFGSGAGYFEKIFKGYTRIKIINNKRDPLFGGVNPEPIDKNLGKLMSEIKKEKADIGIAIDGDADRVGIVDNKGYYITSHKVFSLLLLHNIKYKNLKPDVVRTVSGTFLIDRITQKYGLALFETPVGFNNIAEIMVKSKNDVIGGEESGGIGFSYYLSERDGIFSGLLMLEFLAKEKKSLRKILRDLDKEYGKLRYDRIDVHFNENQRTQIKNELMNIEERGIYNGKKIKSINKKDGIKFIMDDDEWIMFRFSGTEPLLRIYCEAGTLRRVRNNLKFAEKLIQK